MLVITIFFWDKNKFFKALQYVYTYGYYSTALQYLHIIYKRQFFKPFMK